MGLLAARWFFSSGLRMLLHAHWHRWQRVLSPSGYGGQAYRCRSCCGVRSDLAPIRAAGRVCALHRHVSARHAGAAGESYGYNWRGAAVEQPDWRGVRRDVSYFLGYQFAAAPESISGWYSEQKRSYDLSKWRNNTKPVWDEDVWCANRPFARGGNDAAVAAYRHAKPGTGRGDG